MYKKLNRLLQSSLKSDSSASVVSALDRLSARVEALEEENRQLKENLAQFQRTKLDLRTSIDELIQVQKLSETITATLNLDAILASLAESSRQVVEYEVCGVFLFKPDNSDLEALYVDPPSEEFKDRVHFQWEEGILDWVIEQSRISVFPDIQVSPVGCQKERNFIVAPLSLKEKNLGVFVLYTDRPKDAFTNQDMTLLSILTDQTAIAIENSRLYEQLEQANQRLKRSQSQLIQSEKMAAVGQLANGMAHEINNPLQIILSKVQLLLIDFEKMPELVEGLKLIEENTVRIARITKALLDFADHNSARSEKAPLDINSLIQKVASLVTYQLKCSGIKLIIETEEELPLVKADSSQIEQVCLNLISNARHAMPEGGKLTIKTSRGDEFVQVDFMDTGEGIPEKELSRIFEPFFTTRSNQGNPGLGLSNSYGIIQRHGGTIEVQSQVGKGSTFTLRLPVEGAE